MSAWFRVENLRYRKVRHHGSFLAEMSSGAGVWYCDEHVELRHPLGAKYVMFFKNQRGYHSRLWTDAAHDTFWNGDLDDSTWNGFKQVSANHFRRTHRAVPQPRRAVPRRPFRPPRRNNANNGRFPLRRGNRDWIEPPELPEAPLPPGYRDRQRLDRERRYRERRRRRREGHERREQPRAPVEQPRAPVELPPAPVPPAEADEQEDIRRISKGYRWQHYYGKRNESEARKNGYNRPKAPPGTVEKICNRFWCVRKPKSKKRRFPSAECPICMEDFLDLKKKNIDVSRLPCGHLICALCLYHMNKPGQFTKFTCPMCQNKYTPEAIRSAEYIGDGKYELILLHF